MFTIKKPQPVSVPDGTYDAVIDSVEFRATNNGKRYIEASCRIRADQGVPQLRVPYKIWKAKNPGKDDLAVGGYLAFQLFNLAEAAGIPAETNYNTMEDLFADLEGLPISISVESSEYQGRSYASVARVMPSERALSPEEQRDYADRREMERRAAAERAAERQRNAARASESARAQESVRASVNTRVEAPAQTPIPGTGASAAIPADAGFEPLKGDDVPF